MTRYLVPQRTKQDAVAISRLRDAFPRLELVNGITVRSWLERRRNGVTKRPRRRGRGTVPGDKVAA